MTYSSRLRAKLDPKHPCNEIFGRVKVTLPEEYYEKKFQQDLTAGYNIKRNNRCETCFTVKSSNGSCNC